MTRPINCTLDIETKIGNTLHALLCTPAGNFDVYGDSIVELKNEAVELATTLGISIDTFNLTLPE